MIEVDVERFRRDGFITIARLADAETLAQLGAVYDAMLSGEIDVSPTDNPLGGVTRQIMSPSAYHAMFRSNPARTAGREIAKALLGAEQVFPVFDMLIFKQPGQRAATPWHQDFAYSAMPFASANAPIPTDEYVQFWVALDDVDEQNGCMHFVPGAHRGRLFEHYVAAGAPDYSQRLLAIRDAEHRLDLDRSVACPLKAGGATVHSYGTPHYTSGNLTADRPRRAYIFNFSTRRRGESAG